MKRRGGFWLYLRLSVMNLAVVSMFVAISQTPPVVAMYQSVPIFSPVVKKQIKPIKSGIPNQLVIESLGIDLDVGVGSYNPKTGDWTVDATRAFYADVSMPLNDYLGTTLIYGHAQWPVFGNLHSIQPNSKAILYTNNGYIFSYVYQSMQQVLPSDTSVFRNNGDPILVLQTCSGAWDAYRSLFTFKLESVGKI